MLKTSIRAECCHLYDRLPEDVSCFLPNVCAEMRKLISRHEYAFTKRRRLLQLAEPKYREKRFTPKCACKFRNNVEIVRLEQPVYTRTEQLAYPLVRRLLEVKTVYRKVFCNKRLELINRTIRKSLLTLYSRLQNTQPPKKRITVPKRSPKEMKHHWRYLRRLARHKVAPKKPKLRINAMPFKEMSRYKMLALPKEREEPEKFDWVLTPELKNYRITERVKNLYKPKVRDEEAMYQTLPLKIPYNALKYKASKRIQDLAVANEIRAGESDLKENPFAISPNALKARASPRILELAEPKEFENVHLRDNPTLISPAALKAKASPRIIQLAKPRGS